MGAMAADLLNLTGVLLVVLASSFVASLVPGRAVPEVVFFVFLGAIVGPNCLGLVHETSSLTLISRLGLGFLFLTAGYELDPAELMGTMGRHATASWAASMAIALVVVPLLGLDLAETGSLAFAIALTTTAYGTLVPIMRDRELSGTRVGEVIESYGAIGELLPVVAMSVLLTPDRSKAASVVYLLVFVGICLLVAWQADRAKRLGTRLYRFLKASSESASQVTVRTTVLLLVALLLLAELMELDAVLAAFAAGFVLRFVTPDNHSLADRLQTVSNGFFVPVFFVCSGLGISLTAVAQDPVLLLLYVALLLLVRGGVVVASLGIFPETRDMPAAEKVSASLYCTMALPLIVALTEAATDAGAMSGSMASVLVTAGAITVLVIPVITSLLRNVVAVHPVEAIQEIHDSPDEARRIWEQHVRERRDAVRRFHEEAAREREQGHWMSSSDYLAREYDRRRRDASRRHGRHGHASDDEPEGDG